MSDRVWLVAVLFAFGLGYALGGWQGRPDTAPDAAAASAGQDAPVPDTREADDSVIAGDARDGADSPPGKAAGPVALRLPAPVNPNMATAEELAALPGIGPVLAGRIVEARQQRPFDSVDDLRRVKGVGGKLLERLRPYLAVDR